MIVDAWLAAVRNMLAGDSVDQVSHIAIGTGTTGETANDTTLQTEILRKALASTLKPSSKTVQFQINVGTSEGNATLTECGGLNAASGGTLMNRITHTAINKTSSFELRYQIEVALSDV